MGPYVEVDNFSQTVSLTKHVIPTCYPILNILKQNLKMASYFTISDKF